MSEITKEQKMEGWWKKLKQKTGDEKRHASIEFDRHKSEAIASDWWAGKYTGVTRVLDWMDELENGGESDE